MKSNYHLKHVSVFISAIAMLFGAAPLAQAETLSSYVSSKRSEQSAIATNVTSKQVNNQTKQSVSTRAADLLPADNPTVTQSNPASTNQSLTNPIPTNQVQTNPGLNTSTEYSLQPMSPSTSATRGLASAPTNEAVFTETHGDVTTDSSDNYSDSYLSQTDTLDDDGLYDDDDGVLDEDNDTFEDDTDGVFEDDDTLDDDTLEDDTDGVFEDDDTFDDDEEDIFEDDDVDDDDDFLEDVTEPISPGRATRSGPSYIGIGGNIGIGDGDTALGEGSFAAFSKIGLTRNISVRPTVFIDDEPTILLPVTFDFVPGVTEVTENISEDIGFRVSPFVGAGAAISTGDDTTVDFLATAGVDVPLGNNFTGVAAINASLFDDPAVGLLLGIGVNFPALR